MPFDADEVRFDIVADSVEESGRDVPDTDQILDLVLKIYNKF